MSGKSLDQERAAYAWKCVQKQTKDYKNLAKSLPALVMSNGLMQALAFLEAKGKDEHKALLRNIIVALAGSGLLTEAHARQGFNGVMQALLESDSPRYRRATEETLEILKWIRQLADAVVQSR